VSHNQDELIEAALRTLRADSARAAGPVPQSRVEALIETRGLGPEACATLYRALAIEGIVVAEEDPSERAHAFTSRGTTTLDRLMSHRILSRKEEVDLARRYRQGNRIEKALASGTVPDDAAVRSAIRAGEEAFRVLVECNMRLVYSVARRHLRYSSLGVEDLVQEGVVGLMRAVELFDHTREYKLSTYATHWIRQSITRAIVDKGTTIRFPVHVAEDMLKLRRAEDRLQLANGRPATTEELGSELEWSRRRVARVRRAMRTAVVSLDADKDIEGLQGGLSSTIPSPEPSPEEVVLERAMSIKLNAALAALKPRTAAILKRRFGFDAGREETLEEIGQSYNVTRERIRQIEAKGLGALKRPTVARPLRTFLDD